MLLSFLQDPADYPSHFQMFVATVHTGLVLKLTFIRFPSSFILSTVYDYEPKTKDDYIVHVMQRYLELLVAGLGLSTAMVLETFPFRMFIHAQYCTFSQISMTLLVLRLPTWFPGVTFKRAAVECLQAAQHVKEITFQDVKKRMVIHVNRLIGAMN